MNAPRLPNPLPPEAQAAHEMLHDIAHCPNCNCDIVRAKGIVKDGPDVSYFGHQLDGCALVMMISILNDRGQLSEDEMFNRFVTCSDGLLWADLGIVIDSLEEGRYSV